MDAGTMNINLTRKGLESNVHDRTVNVTDDADVTLV